MFSKQINFMQGETYRYIAYIFVYRSYLPFRNNITGLGACIIWNCLLYIVFPLSIEPHKQYGKKIYKEYQSNTRNLNMTQNDLFYLLWFTGGDVHFIFTSEPLLNLVDFNVTYKRNNQVNLTFLEVICIETTAHGRSINFFPQKRYTISKASKEI